MCAVPLMSSGKNGGTVGTYFLDIKRLRLYPHRKKIYVHLGHGNKITSFSDPPAF